MKTADLLDERPNCQCCLARLRHFGGRKRFAGKIAAVLCFEDNTFVRQAVESAGDGRVLVVDGGASPRCALLGDKLAALAAGNNWAGVVLNGMVRDVAELAGMDIGVMALGASPRRSNKEGRGAAGAPVVFGGVVFVPGHYLLADEDGVVVCETPPAA